MSDFETPAAKLIPTPEVLKEWISTVTDPDLGMSLVALGLIYDIQADSSLKSAIVIMTLTSPGCPSADFLVNQVTQRLKEYPGIETVKVDLVFEPKWDPNTMASEDAKEQLGIW